MSKRAIAASLLAPDPVTEKGTAIVLAFRTANRVSANFIAFVSCLPTPSVVSPAPGGDRHLDQRASIGTAYARERRASCRRCPGPFPAR